MDGSMSFECPEYSFWFLILVRLVLNRFEVLVHFAGESKFRLSVADNQVSLHDPQNKDRQTKKQGKCYIL